MAAPEMIYGVHENHSVKRSGQAGGAVRDSSESDGERLCRTVSSYNDQSY
ncbi:hypothetical protein GPC30_001043 [Salmonella enterica]|uniref:Uncharacterized protein n=1 Tax=Salmonella enterica subsp. enterica serovar Sandiego TaxID=1151002 RepID=A0A741M5Y8_SALET|nr:hypothetical protein [Salmonella enterica]EDR0971140.1 hypothetical protein [Salmonella enterica subsp. enterica serovar Thompson]EDT7623731.1 hypothetical protein [Salmonella enterica subsp. enterica serovar Nima]EDV1900026.1 hypothetical protein [Salmonella enterica subsp. enterica]EDW4994135.1 hypothetical protein [Salmonella enterica subsp. enterica serovar Sandiego]EDX7315774.1 hypothetical protein [Salmonella enterica subsp. enterica serovar Alabama]EDY4104300.1 hypothetical protein 